MKQIENDIRDIINETICGKYIGKLKVIKDNISEDSILWSLLLYLDMEMTPIILAHEGTEEEFKDFIRSEIKSRKLQTVHFWKTLQEQHEDYEQD